MAMKKFLLRTFIFAILMIVCDVVVGKVGDYLVAHAKGGTTSRINYMANDTNEDILFFGSSRAIHHYDPNIFEDSLGLTAYNCGFDGNGIICAYGFFRMIEERYHPKFLIYDIASGFDLKSGDNNKYLGRLKTFYDRDCVDSIFWKVDDLERYKMTSKMYRYNSIIPRLVTDNLHPLKTYNKGYLPLDKEMKQDPKPEESDEHVEYDSLKLYYLERLINDCRGKTQLVFAESPKYENTNDDVLRPIKSLCDKYGIPFISHFTDTAFNNHREYFSDRTHLNRLGATKYSEEVAVEVKNLEE